MIAYVQCTAGVARSLFYCIQVTQQVPLSTSAKKRKNRYSLDMNEKYEINFSDKIVMRKQKKRRKTQSFNGVNSGDPAGIRTPDTLLKRQVLCRLSYWVRSKKFCAEYEIKWYAVMAGTAGFAFQRESHGGSNNPPDYSQEPPFESKDSKSAVMAGTAGFEPANVGVKGRCLTAWRRPRIRLLETALP